MPRNESSAATNVGGSGPRCNETGDSVAAMTLREARVLIASRAMSRTAEPQLLEAARVVLRELDTRLPNQEVMNRRAER